MAKKARKTPAQGGKWMGGYYKHPRAKGAGLWANDYHTQVAQRTGHFGTNSNANVYRSHRRRQMVGAAVGTLAMGGALHQHANEGVASGLGAAGVAAHGYGLYHAVKAERHMNKTTGTKRSQIVGYYKPKGKR